MDEQWYQKHKQTIIANARKWHFANPEKRAKIMRKLHYRNRYGITIGDYDRIFQQQNGRCIICGKHQTEFNRRLDIDHNHQTGKIRGLVCKGCNYYIGQVEKGYSKQGKYYEIVKNYLAKSQ